MCYKKLTEDELENTDDLCDNCINKKYKEV